MINSGIIIRGSTKYRSEVMIKAQDIINLRKTNLRENALIVLNKRYLRKEGGIVVESPEEMFGRVALNIALAEEKYNPSITKEKLAEVAQSFYDMIAELKFMPNSPTLMNAGLDLQQLSACFVLPIEDSMESIFEAVKNAALIHKSGGGTGFSFSRLRPKSDMVRTTGGVASGPVSFMKVFNAATEAVKQGGTRRGANMGILKVDHPDILEFITCKADNKEITNFNISVALTEEFMEAVLNDQEYDLINPRTGKSAGKLSAKMVFDKIVESAWANGEPGIVFIDRINKNNPTPELGMIESTNPCGEQPLMPFESCNLGSINVDKFIYEKNGKNCINWDELAKVTWTAVRFLDNVIDMNNYPLKQIEINTKANRKIGLGIMGWADALIRLGIPYDSEEALKLAEEVMAFIYSEARSASIALAQERGPFPNIAKSIYYPDVKLRNATITTIAPTGTISIIAGCSSGIEPLFAVNYYRNVLDNTKLIEMHPYFVEVAKKEGFYSEELMKKVAEVGSISGLTEIPEHVRKVFRVAHDISPEYHVRMQAAFQKYTDNAVSKTINFPHDATKEDVRNAYMLAYKLGCKGITIYRDKSRDVQVLNLSSRGTPRNLKKIKIYYENNEIGTLQDILNIGKQEKRNYLSFKDENGNEITFEELVRSGVDISKLVTTFLPEYIYNQLTEKVMKEALPRKRPQVIKGQTIKMKTGCGALFVTINKDQDDKPFEVFCNIGKCGACANSMNETIGRLISLALRSNIPVEEVYYQLLGIRCNRPEQYGEDKVFSCADAIAKSLKKCLNLKVSDLPPNYDNSANHKPGHDEGAYSYKMMKFGACPGCGGSNIVFSSGCATCYDCGYSDCS